MNEQKQSGHMAVYEIPVSDIAPNPYQPRLEFDDTKLSSMADSISRYGVMQPIVVTKKPGGSYELISGERRLRASKIAGKETIPAVVRDYEHSDEEKFELAIIENIQREDLSPMDKAKAFEKLSNEFGYTHSEIAQKMGKSREYISNSLRLLLLPDNILHEMGRGPLTEGHARPLLMLKDRPYEQGELFKKIISQKLTVRAAEKIARSIATEKLRKLDIEKIDPEIKKMEKNLAEKLGTKVHIDEKTIGEGGKLTIEYFSKEDLEKIINLVKGKTLPNASVLETETEVKKNNGIEKFENNFSNKERENISIGKQVLQSAPAATVFADEIENLEQTEDATPKSETVKVNIDDDLQNKNSESIDGYNISFGAAPKVAEKTEIVSEVTVEETPEPTEEIDNFSTSNWEEDLKEEEYQRELENILKQKSNPEPVVENKINENVTEQKHDITELHLDSEKNNERENIVENNIFSKSDFIIDSKKSEKENMQEPGNNHQEKEHSFEPLESGPAQQVVNEKSAAQQRIDDILAGRKTVSEEYGIKESVKPADSTVDNHTAAPVQKEKNIEESSIYQQFLDSKKKIEEQKNRMFSGDSNEAVDNIGSFSGETSEFTNNTNIHTGNKNEYVEQLNQERENKESLNSILGSEDVDNSVAEVENIFGGSDFVPKTDNTNKTLENTENISDENMENSDSEKSLDDKYSFKGFSI